MLLPSFINALQQAALVKVMGLRGLRCEQRSHSCGTAGGSWLCVLVVLSAACCAAVMLHTLLHALFCIRKGSGP
jgi:hypothetical protein